MKTLKAEPEYRERNYRLQLAEQQWVSFAVAIKETDLYIRAARDLRDLAVDAVLRYRLQLEEYMSRTPEFFRSLTPLPEDEWAPPIVREMLHAARAAGVGPMAAVAGAMAEFVGKDLLAESPEVIVENGGDIFVKSAKAITAAIFAGRSPLSRKVGLRIPPSGQGWGICTSSGTVGPSLSFGCADAVCVISHSASLADAAATAIGNVVQNAAALEEGLKVAKKVDGLSGAVIILGDKLGAWGDVELVALADGGMKINSAFIL